MANKYLDIFKSFFTRELASAIVAPFGQGRNPAAALVVDCGVGLRKSVANPTLLVLFSEGPSPHLRVSTRKDGVRNGRPGAG